MAAADLLADHLAVPPAEDLLAPVTGGRREAASAGRGKEAFLDKETVCIPVAYHRLL